MILDYFHKHGYEAYIVGGAVRDRFLNVKTGDIDIATSARPEEVQKIFDKTFPIGIQHGTVLVRYDHEHYEVTTFRSESVYEDFRHPKHVTFEKSIEADLARRDFTMNAMAMDRHGQIIDPYNGQEDLEQKLLCTVGVASERFQEDPLRILRAARFIAQLNLNPALDLEKAAKEQASGVQHVSIERIHQEITKLLRGHWANKGFQFLHHTGVAKFLPDFQIENIFSKAIPDLANLETDPERWSALILHIELNHIEQFLRDWRFSKKDKNAVLSLIKNYQEMLHKEWTPYILFKISLEQAFAIERLKKVFSVTNVPKEKLVTMNNDLPIHNRSELAISGHNLIEWTEKTPGPWLQDLLDSIEKAVVEGALENDREAIKKWVKRCPEQNNTF